MKPVSRELFIHRLRLFQKFLHLLNLLLSLAKHLRKYYFLVNPLLVLVILLAPVLEYEYVLAYQVDDSSFVVSYTVLEVCESLVP